MYIELVLALALGAVVALLFLNKKKSFLKAQDDWWGEGSGPQGSEDDSIRPFKIEATSEEIEVNHFKHGCDTSQRCPFNSMSCKIL